MLDPTLARTFVGRIVFAALCDKLFDIDEKLNIVPQLATALRMVGRQQGADAEAAPRRHVPRRREARRRRGQVQHRAPQDDAGLEPPRRARAGRERRRRRSDDRAAQPVGAVRAAARAARRPRRHDGLAQGRAGRGRQVRRQAGVLGTVPFVERVAQDRIVLERYPNYWNKGEIHFDQVVYLPIVDSTVRLANLRSGQLDFIERMAPSDVPQLKTDSRFKIAKITEIGYQGITINVGKSDQAQKNPLGKDARVREAFELSLDRDGIVQVVMDGEANVGNQWVAPTNAFYAKNVPVPKRDVARAKALLKEAGVPNPSFTLMTPTTSDAQRIAQVVQAMVKEAGFDVKIQSTEFATSLDLADKGQFEAYVLAWSGRADPDGNIFSFDGCKQPLNYAGYCKPEVDELLNQSRTTRDPAERQEAVRADRRARAEGPADRLSLSPPLAVGVHGQAAGLRTIPDGLVRVQG